jgi:hypothetical protein
MKRKEIWKTVSSASSAIASAIGLRAHQSACECLVFMGQQEVVTDSIQASVIAAVFVELLDIGDSAPLLHKSFPVLIKWFS